MKSILIIGMGKFGKHLCKSLSKMGNDLMIVDKDESKLTDLIYQVTSAKVGDCTNPEVLKSIGVSDFEYVIVAIDNDFQSSLEVTSLVKEMGAQYVISKADKEVQAKFLSRNGADQVIYPDFDIAKRLAMRLTANHIYDYIVFSDEYAMYEIDINHSWIGKTLRELDFFNKYHLNVVGFKKDGKTEILPGADRQFNKDEHLLVIGSYEDVQKALK